MKGLLFLFIVIQLSYSQSKWRGDFIDESSFTFDQLVDIDNFGNKYYIHDNDFFQYKNDKLTEYTNIQLGNLFSADVFNPLKINLFYQDLNTLIVLDNRLADITKVDFNNLPFFRLVTHVSTGNDNTVWIYNQNTQQLELFDYLERKTRITTLPIEGNVMSITSDYNYCWILTDRYLYKYNYVGSLLYKLDNNGFESIEENNENLFLLRENKIYVKPFNEQEISLVELPDLLINHFLVTDDSLYIYSQEKLLHYQLKFN